jgi:hypothetical protein
VQPSLQTCVKGVYAAGDFRAFVKSPVQAIHKQTFAGWGLRMICRDRWYINSDALHRIEWG